MRTKQLRQMIVIDHPDQSALPCVSPVSLGEKLTQLTKGPLLPPARQQALDIGFWNPMRNQLELF